MGAGGAARAPYEPGRPLELGGGDDETRLGSRPSLFAPRRRGALLDIALFQGLLQVGSCTWLVGGRFHQCVLSGCLSQSLFGRTKHTTHTREIFDFWIPLSDNDVTMLERRKENTYVRVQPLRPTTRLQHVITRSPSPTSLPTPSLQVAHFCVRASSPDTRLPGMFTCSHDPMSYAPPPPPTLAHPPTSPAQRRCLLPLRPRALRETVLVPPAYYGKLRDVHFQNPKDLQQHRRCHVQILAPRARRATLVRASQEPSEKDMDGRGGWLSESNAKASSPPPNFPQTFFTPSEWDATVEEVCASRYISIKHFVALQLMYYGTLARSYYAVENCTTATTSLRSSSRSSRTAPERAHRTELCTDGITASYSNRKQAK